MDAIAARDAEALSALYDRHAPGVMGVCLRILRDRADAEEVTGDVFIEIWNRAERFDPTRGHPVAYLLSLARSRAIDRRRGSVRREQIFTAPDDSEPRSPADTFQSASIAQMRGHLEHALADLQSGQRQALELAYFNGMSHTEVAARLGEPLGTVKTRIRQGLLRLRERLAAVYGEGALS